MSGSSSGISGSGKSLGSDSSFPSGAKSSVNSGSDLESLSSSDSLDSSVGSSGVVSLGSVGSGSGSSGYPVCPCYQVNMVDGSGKKVCFELSRVPDFANERWSFFKNGGAFSIEYNPTTKQWEGQDGDGLPLTPPPGTPDDKKCPPYGEWTRPGKPSVKIGPCVGCGSSGSSGSSGVSGISDLSSVGSGSSAGAGGVVVPAAAAAAASGWWDFNNYVVGGGVNSSGSPTNIITDYSPLNNVLTEVGGPALDHPYGCEVQSNDNYFKIGNPAQFKGIWFVGYFDHAGASVSPRTNASFIAVAGGNASPYSYLFTGTAALGYGFSVDGAAGDQGAISIDYGAEIGPGTNMATHAAVANKWTSIRTRFTGSGDPAGIYNMIGRFLNPTTYQFRGVLSEVIVFQDYPSEEIVEEIENYLKAKYSALIPVV